MIIGEIIEQTNESSYLLGDRSLSFWIQGFVMIFIVTTLVLSWMKDRHQNKATTLLGKLQHHFSHYARAYMLSILASYVGMIALEWTIDLFTKYSTIKLPHSENDFLYFIPFSGFIAYKVHNRFHKNKK